MMQNTYRVHIPEKVISAIWMCRDINELQQSAKICYPHQSEKNPNQSFSEDRFGFFVLDKIQIRRVCQAFFTHFR